MAGPRGGRRVGVGRVALVTALSSALTVAGACGRGPAPDNGTPATVRPAAPGTVPAPGAPLVDEQYRLAPPDHAVTIAAVAHTTVDPGGGTTRTTVRIWNLGTEADTYTLVTTTGHGTPAVVRPATVMIAGRSTTTVDLELGPWADPAAGRDQVDVELSSPHFDAPPAGALVDLAPGDGAAAPQAVDDTATTPTGQPIELDLLANDDAPGGLDRAATRVHIGVPGTGRAETQPDGRVRFTPYPGFTGATVASYQVCDLRGRCSLGTATITVG